ncbi:hypothetical protein AO398_00375 [Methylobacterium sp. GXS13]|uniref:hypothetical protein n=1 Tax=Methylobacterium sp. GXS13 TaxID=1730094 RepID=UPI00071BC952|nr:hypothetical protein [Methylobacterium sp. GXS13]KST61180.1 hypothetical protein AO398_00375 [Methylobacterium sp. GXS13]
MRETFHIPTPAHPETGARRIGRIRRQTADRMASMRDRWRAEGRPDPATLDRAIADALRDAIAATVREGVTSGPVDPQAILRGVARQVVGRTEAARDAGREGVVYRREAVADALWKRLLQPKKASS